MMILLLTSCSSYTATGAMTGGMIGSAVGGIFGGHYGHDVGTLVGAATGAAVGANAEARARRNAERRYYEYTDDVYSSNRQTDKARKERIRSYHNKVARKYRVNGQYNPTTRANENGFTLVMDSVAVQQGDNSGFSQNGQYDDRIEMK